MAPTFFDLPLELREQVYQLVVVKPRNTVTMLNNAYCFNSEVSASQPALAYVNRQVRAECLKTFYTHNVFLAEVTQLEDLEVAQRWLKAIGDHHVARLRRLALCGWTRVPFGHMARRQWVRIILDLKDDEVLLGDDPPSHVMPHVEDLKTSFRAIVEARGGKPFDAEGLGAFMGGFHSMCVGY